MKSLKTILKPVHTDLATERISVRFQDGVEICEREALHTCRMSSETNGEPSEPRLVLRDSVDPSNVFISKGRSDIRGLNSLLRSLTS